LVRGIPVPLPGLSSFASGKEDHPSLVRPLSSFDLETVFEDDTQPKAGDKKPAPAPLPTPKKPGLPAPAPVQPAAQANASGQPVSGQPVPNQPVPAQTTPLQPAPTQPQPATVVTPSSAPSTSPIPVPAPVQRSLLQIAAPSSVTAGQQFSLDIKISDAKDLANAPFVLTYDPVFVEFVSISEGALLKSDGKPTTFSGKSDAAAGTVNVTSVRATGNAGVNGGGTLATVLFKAKTKGPASFAFKNSMFTSSNGAALSILPFSTAVDIR
jgi:general secretion pathway protein D